VLLGRALRWRRRIRSEREKRKTHRPSKIELVTNVRSNKRQDQDY
jgi:hypothetical protein